MSIRKIHISIQDIEDAKIFFGVDNHYKMMNSLVQDRLDTIANPSQIDDADLDNFFVRFMLALTDWNGNAYGTGRKSAMEDYYALKPIFKSHLNSIIGFRRRSILSLVTEDEAVIKSIYGDFDKILSHVGTAKGLHLVAPRFFIAWDNKIRQGYGLGDKPKHYIEFLTQSKEQVLSLKSEGYALNDNILKLLDQFNFWHFTRNRGE